MQLESSSSSSSSSSSAELSVVGTLRPKSQTSKRFPPVSKYDPCKFGDAACRTNVYLQSNPNCNVSLLNKRLRTTCHTDLRYATSQVHNSLPIPYPIPSQPIVSNELWKVIHPLPDPKLPGGSARLSNTLKNHFTTYWLPRFTDYESVPCNVETWEHAIGILDPVFPCGLFGSQHNNFLSMVQFTSCLPCNSKTRLHLLLLYVFQIVMQCYLTVNGRFLQKKHPLSHDKLCHVFLLSYFLDVHDGSLNRNEVTLDVILRHRRTYMSAVGETFFESCLLPMIHSQTIIHVLIAVVSVIPNHLLLQASGLQSEGEVIDHLLAHLREFITSTWLPLLPSYHYVTLPVVMYPEMENNGDSSLPYRIDETKKQVHVIDAIASSRQNDHPTEPPYAVAMLIPSVDQKSGGSNSKIYFMDVDYLRNSTAKLLLQTEKNSAQQQQQNLQHHQIPKPKKQQKKKPQTRRSSMELESKKEIEETAEEEEGVVVVKKKKRGRPPGSRNGCGKNKRRFSLPIQVKEEEEEEDNESDESDESEPLQQQQQYNATVNANIKPVIGSSESHRFGVKLFYHKGYIPTVFGHHMFQKAHLPFISLTNEEVTDLYQNTPLFTKTETSSVQMVRRMKQFAWVLGFFCPRKLDRLLTHGMKKWLPHEKNNNNHNNSNFFNDLDCLPAQVSIASLCYSEIVIGSDIYYPPLSVFRHGDLQNPLYLTKEQMSSLIQSGRNQNQLVGLSSPTFDCNQTLSSLLTSVLPSVARDVVDVFTQKKSLDEDEDEETKVIWYHYLLLWHFLTSEEDVYAVLYDIYDKSLDHILHALHTESRNYMSLLSATKETLTSNSLLTSQQTQDLNELVSHHLITPPSTYSILQTLFTSLPSSSSSLDIPPPPPHILSAFVITRAEPFNAACWLPPEQTGMLDFHNLKAPQQEECFNFNISLYQRLNEPLHAYLLSLFPAQAIPLPDNQGYIFSQLQKNANALMKIYNNTALMEAVNMWKTPLESWSYIQNQNQLQNIKSLMTFLYTESHFQNQNQQQNSNSISNHQLPTLWHISSLQHKLEDETNEVIFQTRSYLNNKPRLMRDVGAYCCRHGPRLPSSQWYEKVNEYITHPENRVSRTHNNGLPDSYLRAKFIAQAILQHPEGGQRFYHLQYCPELQKKTMDFQTGTSSSSSISEAYLRDLLDTTTAAGTGNQPFPVLSVLLNEIHKLAEPTTD